MKKHSNDKAIKKSFDYWQALYKRDPVLFQYERWAELNTLAESKSSNAVNSALQEIWKQDVELRKIKSDVVRAAREEYLFFENISYLSEKTKHILSDIKSKIEHNDMNIAEAKRYFETISNKEGKDDGNSFRKR